MLRFNILGEYIDLYENTTLTFKKKNILFAFENIECERSASFSIPATQQNDKIFGLSRWLNTTGAGMRRRYDAQLQDAMVTKSGYLYIDSYDGKDYKAVFVTGDLLGLQAIRNIGNIDTCGIFDYYKNAVEALTPSRVGVSALASNTRLWENVNYRRSVDSAIRPSINISMLLQDMGIADADGVIASLNLRWIPKSMQPVQDEYLEYILNVRGTHSGAYVPMQQQAVNVSETRLEQSLSTEYYIDDAFMTGGDRVLVKYAAGSTEYHGYVTQLRPRFDTTIYFASNTPNDIFIGYFNAQTGSGQDYALLSDFNFLGNYSFDTQGQTIGTPLAGRGVRIPAGSNLCIIRKAWWSSAGWNITTPDYTIYYNNTVFDNYQDNPPEIWRLKDNLPSCTAVDLLKAIAALTGRLLYYTEAGGISFLQTIYAGDTKELTGAVIDNGDVQRKFADYAQNNLVKFAADNGQFTYEIDEANYPIDNVNLAEARTLQTLPAGNGGVYEDRGTYKVLSVREDEDANIFGYYDTRENIYLCRVKLQKNADLQALCDASTYTQIRARMTLMEFELLTPRTRLYYDGINYVWTEAQWSKGVVTLKLSKT